MLIDSFKNIERLRYRLNSDLSEIKEHINKNSDMWYEEMILQISSAIISAMAAGAITNGEFSNVKGFIENLIGKLIHFDILKSILGWGITLLFFIGIYVLFFVIAKILIKRIKYVKKNNGLNEQLKVDYQKEFDNIACDSIFVAYEYKTAYENPKLKDKNLKTFYFCEILHYLETACFITRDLCKHKSLFIKCGGRKEGVDLYRIYNMVDLMNEILSFLESEKGNILLDESFKEKLDKQIDGIREIIQKEVIKVIDSLN